MGGPDGGSGGDGGDVWLQADHNAASLLGFRDHPFRRATDGAHGKGKKQDGSNGDDLVARVPEGTIVLDRDGTVLADLIHHGDRYLAAHGGQGGRGNATFLSNRRRAPNFAEQGEAGEEVWLDLELKLQADVAVVGFPNSGKSTLISVVSAAKPKIADYPFTTLVPNLGVVRTSDAEFVMADIPGLIEGAAEGKGLGHQFLRHVERARVLLVLVDLAAADGRPPADQERVLLDELGRYQPDLLERPRLVVGSRADVGTSTWDGLTMAAVSHRGVDEVVGRLATLVAEARHDVPDEEGFVVLRPQPEGFAVERLPDGRGYVVTGRAAVRAVALSDVTTHEAVAYIQDRLHKLGVIRALERAGATEGDTVYLGDHAFSFER